MAVTLSKLGQFLGDLRGAAQRYGANLPATTAQYLRLHYGSRYRRKEIFQLGIIDPATPADHLARLISCRDATKLQRAINPKGYVYITEDKGIFYNYCAGADIRIPRLYAVFDPAIGWTPDQRWLDSKDAWLRFFQDELPDCFVVKPNWGIRSKAVYILARNGQGFTDSYGQHYTTAELYEVLASHAEYDRFVIQEKVEPHPDLLALTATPAMHTVRVVTGVDGEGTVQILFAVQRFGTESNWLDDFELGATENILAEVSPGGGTILKAVARAKDGIGLESVDIHPKSGQRVLGFQVPFWPETRELVIDAARKFLPIRTVGWDIAITPEGPVMIEGNIFWSLEFHNALGDSTPFLDYVKAMNGAAGKGRLPDTNPSRRW